MFKNWKFKYKIILLPFLATVSFILILVVNQILGMNNEKLLTNIEIGYAPALDMSRDLEDMLVKVQRGMQDAVASADTDMLIEMDVVRDEFTKRVDSAAENIVVDPREMEILKTQFLEYCNLARDTSQRMMGEEVGQGMETALESMVNQFNGIKNKLASQKEKNSKAMTDAFAKARESQENSLKIMAGIIAISLLLLIAFSWSIVKGLIGPLRILSEGFARMAAGDFTQDVEISSKDEIGDLGHQINVMTDSLKKLIGRIKITSEQVASAAEEISVASGQIAKGAQSQASAADETGASMEQMSVSIQNVAKNAESLASNVNETTSSIQQMGSSAEGIAKNAESMASNVSETSSTIEQMIVTIERTGKNVDEADKLSQQARAEADAGSEAVMKTVEGMKSISDMMGNINGVIQRLGERSTAIGGIVKVIEEIADQTNLLALNAAIEAARAGDAGRGFAVVADEVRKLAERSVKATKEISGVIMEAQAETDSAVKATEDGARSSNEGIELADQASIAITKIIEAVNATSKIMQETATATGEQSTAAKNVISAVEDMNRLTQSVTQSTREQASGVRQVVQSAESMADMTEQVKNATIEQRQGGENVVSAVENISEIAKSNLSAVEQLSRSAKDMAQQSEGLQELVQEFKLD